MLAVRSVTANATAYPTNLLLCFVSNAQLRLHFTVFVQKDSQERWQHTQLVGDSRTALQFFLNADMTLSPGSQPDP